MDTAQGRQVLSILKDWMSMAQTSSTASLIVGTMCHDDKFAITMMNGGCISLVTKKHTISAGSTCEDELIEFCNGVHKVCGFRNMSSEMGMHQDEPAVIYQENEAAVQIELHCGSLSSRSKHMQLAVLRSRNKFKDQLVKPVFRRTTEMWANIGTKAFPDKQFAYLRDKMNGYALVKKHHPSYMMPDYIT